MEEHRRDLQQKQGNMDLSRHYYEQAKNVYEDIGTVSSPDYAGLLRSIGASHAAQGHMDQARLFYELLSACGKGSRPECAVQRLDEMRQDELQPNCIIYNGRISACGKGSMPEWALQRFDEMRQDNSSPM